MKRLILLVAAMLAIGAIAGYAWAQLAHPAEWEVRTGGSIVLTEAAARDQFTVIMVFIGIGVAVSLVWAWLASVMVRDLGWWLTPVVIVVTGVAAVIAWRVGILVGPEGPLHAVHPAVGDKLPSKLAVDGVAPFLTWPIGALLGVVCGTWLSREDPVADGSIAGLSTSG
ncbi:MAG: hypothetical protein QOJ72_1858 [Nocardioidaceae bacterium]|jgi:hypothetical protein|nr:hypothetical protein [Nocardioidaceae bacterium]